MKNLDYNQIKIFINLKIIGEEKLYIIYCGTWPKNNGLVQIQARPRSVLSEEKSQIKHCSGPITIKEACPRSNSSSDTTKSDQRPRP